MTSHVIGMPPPQRVGVARHDLPHYGFALGWTAPALEGGGAKPRPGAREREGAGARTKAGALSEGGYLKLKKSIRSPMAAPLVGT